MALPRAFRPIPEYVVEANRKSEKKQDVMRLVEAIIKGGVDLSPEEMVDAAFLMVEHINSKLYGKE